MTAHYDSMVDQYVAYASSSPTRPIEMRTMLQLAGEIEGRSVLDLACGSGYYGREFLRHGAGRAHGVDQSQGMIDYARALSADGGDGMTFEVHDVTAMPATTEYDIVLAAYLFNYAQSLQALQQMFESVIPHVKRGGRLVVQTLNPEFRMALGNYAAYGVKAIEEVPWREGARLVFEFPGSPPARITNYRWAREHYEHAIRSAGFRAVSWHEPHLLEADIRGRPAGYWEEYVHNCMSVNLVCDR